MRAMDVSLVVLALAVGWVAYTYLGYPLIVTGAARIWGRARPAASGEPTVALIVSAHNEERVIGEKLTNALALAYPSEKLSIWVSSDGSTDRTNVVVREVAATEPRVRLCAYPRNRGKTASLMDTLSQIPASTEVIVFSDANGLYEPEAVKLLVRHFSDPGVGAVTGELILAGPSAEGTYRRFENWLKRQESALGSCVVGEGSIFAARRALVPKLADWQIEDLSIPLAITLAGFSVVYEQHARSTERFTLTAREQFERRKRIVNRSVRSALALRRIFNPFAAPLGFFVFVSHRVMRWVAPAVMLIGLAAGCVTLLLAAPLAFVVTVTAVALAAAIASAPFARRKTAGRFRRLLFAFAVANAAILAGLISATAGARIVTWEPSR